jgi:arginine decarboxylase
LGVDGAEIALQDVVNAASAQCGLRIPLLVRFTDILGHKLRRMQAAFAGAMADLEYTGGYTAVFPIKVNQQRSVVAELVRSGTSGFGLEAGSKPELVAVLAMSQGGTVICNGYKDREYIRLALIGRKLGLDVYIVIEKANELPLVLEESARLGVQPLLGVRMRLASLGAGKWQNTGGDKAKFGLLPRQVLDLSAQLKAAGMNDALRLVHCHMGSQISNVRDIAAGMREMSRYLIELTRLGHPIETVDVGGGLGIDYEGTRSRSDCSINYGLDEYAHAIVSPLAECCREHSLAMPRIITEAGRAMTAHHAVLVANVTAVEQGTEGAFDAAQLPEHPVLRHLHQLCGDLGRRPPTELFHEAQHYLSEGLARFALGQLSLAERAALDDLYYTVVRGVIASLNEDVRSQRELKEELEDRLADKYFLNFSVFQSVPDVWALEQVFPIVPLTRLDEKPERRGVLEDLTCDSDGRIDRYVDSEGLENSMPLHALKPGEIYNLGLFLVGAYQETLGDMHNLFGDTDSINVALDSAQPDGYTLSAAREGDTTGELLKYVGYDIEQLRQAYRSKITAAALPLDEAELIANALESGLQGYTYLA